MTPRMSRRAALKAGGALAGGTLVPGLLARPAGAQESPMGISWPADQALPTFAQPQHLEVVDLSGATPEEQMVFNTLQGLVARSRPTLYGLWPNGNDDVWLSRLGVPASDSDLWSAVLRHRDAARGVIVYDPALPDTINVATTLAGLRDGVVADPALAAKLAAGPYRLPTLVDLRGRFTNRLQAYAWQFQTLWPHCTHRMLTGMVGNLVQPVARTSDYRQVLIETRQIHDFSNRAVRTIDLSPFLGSDAVYVRFEDADPGDGGWGPAVTHVTVTADGQVIADLVPGSDGEEALVYDGDHTSSVLIAPEMSSEAQRFADVTQYWVYRLTPPAGTRTLTLSVDVANEFAVYATNVQPAVSDTSHPYAYIRDYQVANRCMSFSLGPNQRPERDLFAEIAGQTAPNTPYVGWFGGSVADEWAGVGLLSSHSVYVLASDYNTNQTVHSGMHMRPRRSPVATAPPLENKIYLTFCVSDGDNIQYCEHRLQQTWDDPGRGKVPITWTIQPHLATAMPAILDYYQRTATDNDCLMTGASGAGYVVPIQWPDDTFPSYANMTHDLMQRLGITTVSVINYLNWSNSAPLSGAKASDYSQIINPLGIVLPAPAPQLIILDGGTPESNLSGAGDVGGTQAVIASLSQGWDGTAPAFFALQPSGWTMTPTDLANVANSLDNRYQIVRGDQFFELIRRAEQEGVE